MDCLTCHEPIFDETALGGTPGVFPKESKCLSCHKKEKESGNCAFCHLTEKPRTYFKRDPHLVMNHAKHLEKDEKCEVCHVALPAKGQVEWPVPSMAACNKCHNHQEQFDNGQCTACHIDLERFPLSPSHLLQPPRELHPGPSTDRPLGVGLLHRLPRRTLLLRLPRRQDAPTTPSQTQPGPPGPQLDPLG